MGATEAQEPGGGGTTPAATSPVAQDPHHSIAMAAKAITTPGGTTSKYSESTHLKQLRRHAQQASPGEARQAWKQVNKTKAAEKKQWLRQKAEEASQLSWGAFRSVQQHKQRKQGWQLPLLDPGDCGRRNYASTSGGSSTESQPQWSKGGCSKFEKVSNTCANAPRGDLSHRGK